MNVNQLKSTKEMEMEIQKKFPFLKLISDYTGANNKCTIKCELCGHIWNAVPRSISHSKCGCPNCQVAKLKHDKSEKIFIKKLQSTNFELLKYISHKKVIVKCKVCGYIRQTTSSNILRFGCNNCAIQRVSDSQRLIKEDFIKRAIEIHGNFYDYSKVNYKSYNSKVEIICPIHGSFWQTPGHHLSGQHCPKCKGRIDTEEFIRLSKQIHKNLYDYSLSEYKDVYTPIKIICKKHGVFYQLPYVHYGVGCGCQKCKMSHGEELIMHFLDKNNILYIYQKSFEKKNKKGRFVVDFYIPKLNMIIEFNGQQHYYAVDIFGGEEKFKQQKERDEDLKQFCKDLNIRLLEIKYNQDVDQTISMFLKTAV